MIDLIVTENDRLNFKNSKPLVKDFLIKRLMNFNFNNIKFIDLKTLNKDFFKLLKGKSKFILILDIMDPFLDYDLVMNSINFSEKYKIKFLRPIGHVGGTGYSLLINKNLLEKKIKFENIKSNYFEHDTQEKYNNQFNLYKFKRLKIFLALIKKNKLLYKYSIKEIISYLNKTDVYKFLMGITENVKLKKYKNCPHCSSSLKPIFNSLSQPMIGYVSSKYPHYHECLNCGLIVATPRISPENIHLIYDEWDKQDFSNSSNNPYKENSRRCNFNDINLNLNRNLKLIDLGGGEGNYSRYIKSKFPKWDVYHSDYSLKLNVGSDIKAMELDFTRDKIDKEKFNFITAWEVIEHVPYEKLKFVFNNIYNGLSKDGYFIFSTPDYNSPLIKILDFYSVGLPFHYTILSRKWLDDFIIKNTDFQIHKIDHTSDFLDDYKNWFGYAIKTSKNLKELALYEVLVEVFQNGSENLKSKLLDNGIGTEIIYYLRKRI